jgi:hypothetical protein
MGQFLPNAKPNKKQRIAYAKMPDWLGAPEQAFALEGPYRGRALSKHYADSKTERGDLYREGFQRRHGAVVTIRRQQKNGVVTLLSLYKHDVVQPATRLIVSEGIRTRNPVGRNEESED